jgi:hypothetical protein
MKTNKSNSRFSLSNTKMVSLVRKFVFNTKLLLFRFRKRSRLLFGGSRRERFCSLFWEQLSFFLLLLWLSFLQEKSFFEKSWFFWLAFSSLQWCRSFWLAYVKKRNQRVMASGFCAERSCSAPAYTRSREKCLSSGRLLGIIPIRLS